MVISNHRAIPGPCSPKPARRPVMVQSVTSKLGAGGWCLQIDDAPTPKVDRRPFLIPTASIYVSASITETQSSGGGGGGRVAYFANGPLAQVT